MTNYIELNTFVKLKGFATTGGNAKIFIRDGNVKVNGEIETRNKKKLLSGDIINISEKEFTISEDLCKMHKD